MGCLVSLHTIVASCPHEGEFLFEVLDAFFIDRGSHDWV